LTSFRGRLDLPLSHPSPTGLFNDFFQPEFCAECNLVHSLGTQPELLAFASRDFRYCGTGRNMRGSLRSTRSRRHNIPNDLHGTSWTIHLGGTFFANILPQLLTASACSCSVSTLFSPLPFIDASSSRAMDMASASSSSSIAVFEADPSAACAISRSSSISIGSCSALNPVDERESVRLCVLRVGFDVELEGEAEGCRKKLESLVWLAGSLSFCLPLLALLP
jgi:hypothetical protein